jgi:hypothetical protein
MHFVLPQAATAICIPASAAGLIPSQPHNTAVESVTFGSPSHLQIIPAEVFEDCISLKSICIPISVNKLEDSAFYHCNSLSIVVFESPSTVTEFGSTVFALCRSLESIHIPPSLLHIGSWCFRDARLLSQVIFDSPSQLTSIGLGVFQGCPRLTFLYIPACLKIIDGISFLVAASFLLRSIRKMSV